MKEYREFDSAKFMYIVELLLKEYVYCSTQKCIQYLSLVYFYDSKMFSVSNRVSTASALSGIYFQVRVVMFSLDIETGLLCYHTSLTGASCFFKLKVGGFLMAHCGVTSAALLCCQKQSFYASCLRNNISDGISEKLDRMSNHRQKRTGQFFNQVKKRKCSGSEAMLHKANVMTQHTTK